MRVYTKTVYRGYHRVSLPQSERASGAGRAGPTASRHDHPEVQRAQQSVGDYHRHDSKHWAGRRRPEFWAGRGVDGCHWIGDVGSERPFPVPSGRRAPQMGEDFDHCFVRRFVIHWVSDGLGPINDKRLAQALIAKARQIARSDKLYADMSGEGECARSNLPSGTKSTVLNGQAR